MRPQDLPILYSTTEYNCHIKLVVSYHKPTKKCLAASKTNIWHSKYFSLSFDKVALLEGD